MQRWAVVLISLAGVLAYKIGKNISWGFAPLTFTTLFSGIVPCLLVQTRYDVGFVKNILGYKPSHRQRQYLGGAIGSAAGYKPRLLHFPASLCGASLFP